MRIEYEVKLDFRDVLIRPKRSVLKTRADVSLERELNSSIHKQPGKAFPLLQRIWIIPVRLNMANALAEHGLLTALDKFITLKNGKNSRKIIPKYCLIVLFLSVSMKLISLILKKL